MAFSLRLTTLLAGLSALTAAVVVAQPTVSPAQPATSPARQAASPAQLSTSAAQLSTSAAQLSTSAAQQGTGADAGSGVDSLAVLASQPDLPETAIGNSVFLAATSCGVERWAVKTGTDSEARAIKLSPAKPVSIATLRSYAKPSSYPATRIGTVEKTVYQVDATLTKYKSESDGDLHLVLSDAAGKTLIVEIPDPACMGSSPWKASVTAVRKAFASRYTATSSFKTTSKHVVVNGVGFFDKIHGQTGVAPNGIELHAVTGISF